MDTESDSLDEGEKKRTIAILGESFLVLILIIGGLLPIYFNLGISPPQGALISVPYITILLIFSPFMSDNKYHYKNHRSKRQREGVVVDVLTLGFVATVLTLAFGLLWTRAPVPDTIQWDLVSLLIGGLTIPLVANELIIRWKY